MASRPAEGSPFSFLLADKAIHTTHRRFDVTKAQEIYEEIERRIANGTEKADAFKALAEETGRPFDSLRGSYYTHKRKLDGGEGNKPARTRRRETTPDDALADACASLERSIAAIDKEVEAAKSRAQEAAAEYESIRGSADERKAAIAERLEALK
jgi:chromosome segregation ATPase